MEEISGAASVIASNKAILVDVLKTLGAISAQVEYHGSGDEGFMDEIYLVFPWTEEDEKRLRPGEPQTTNADGRRVHKDAGNFPVEVTLKHFGRRSATVSGADGPVRKETLPLRHALEMFAEQLLEFHGHSYYQDGEGGDGSISICVETGKYVHDHNDFYRESANDCHEG